MGLGERNSVLYMSYFGCPRSGKVDISLVRKDRWKLGRVAGKEWVAVGLCVSLHSLHRGA